MGSARPSITIIGTGALGGALLDYFKNSDYQVKSVWNSQMGRIYSGKNSRTVSYSIPREEDELGEWIFITTPDQLISEVAESLSRISVDWDEKSVIHCSGNLFSYELDSLKNKGASTLSMHPIQTFRRGDTRERFRDIFMSLEGDPETGARLESVIKDAGAKAVHLNRQQKRDLHIGAVMASNYLVSLIFSAENYLKSNQLEGGLELLESLIRQSVENILSRGTQESLSGPISRGDSETVRKHLERLKGTDLERIYRLLGKAALKLSEKKGNLSSQERELLKALLDRSD